MPSSLFRISNLVLTAIVVKNQKMFFVYSEISNKLRFTFIIVLKKNDNSTEFLLILTSILKSLNNFWFMMLRRFKLFAIGVLIGSVVLIYLFQNKEQGTWLPKNKLRENLRKYPISFS